MVVWYLARLMVHLLAGMLICAICFPFSKAATQEKIIRRWSRQLIKKCHIELKFIDQSSNSENSSERALIACNHVSWLDIFVLNALHPCHFVAKSDIRGWPMIGWLSAQAGTIF